MLRSTPATRPRALLIIILLAGMALRCWKLGAASLWYDETVSVYLAGSPIPELLRHTAGDIHPPGYYLLLRAWLIAAGYPTGHADAHGQGLEFAAGFLSLILGVLLIALVYALGKRVGSAAMGPGTGAKVALMAAALVAISPYNVWYGQEVRMYTLGAGLGVLAVLALWEALRRRGRREAWRWWFLYAVSAAAGMYILYYFVFLLVAVNVWAIVCLLAGARSFDGAVGGVGTDLTTSAEQPGSTERHSPRGSLRQLHLARVVTAANPRARDPFLPYILANLAALLLYAPWIPIAWRQATQPPVPPWRTTAGVVAALRESWIALTAGQSAPNWLWPALLLFLPVYLLGAAVLLHEGALTANRGRRPLRYRLARSAASPSVLLVSATFGSLLLILVASAITPLYHVRYVFTYSPAFYVISAAGLAALWRRLRGVGVVVAGLWIISAAVTLQAFWYDPQYQTDDHRAAVAYLQNQWQPGDVVVVNAGYAYTALATYWQPAPGGDAVTASATGKANSRAWRGRLTATLPLPRQDTDLVALTTGHVDGPPGLGWGDPLSDFYAMPSTLAKAQIDRLLATFGRVWQYRIYDTVNDPQGLVRATLAQHGQLFDDRVFAGDAFLRVQGFVPRAAPAPDATWLRANAAGLAFGAAPVPREAASGTTIHLAVGWRPEMAPLPPFAVSLRLVDSAGQIWAQPPDVQPLGPQFPAPDWPAGAWQRQPLSLPIPEGTPPGAYQVDLVIYDPASGRPWPIRTTPGGLAASGDGVTLGDTGIQRSAAPYPLRSAPAIFGPLALVSAVTPATSLAPGASVPVEINWQARLAPAQPYVVVLQLLDSHGKVATSLEAQPLAGRYPTQDWEAHELVRDRHTLAVPADLPPGRYQLVVGLYAAPSGPRLQTHSGILTTSDHYTIKTIEIHR